ncbi:MAG: immunoglobulin domain-containing protein [Bacteroidales bacterium]
MATEKWTTVHPIPWRNTSFTYLPWWLFDIIVAANTAGEDWRDYAEDKYKLEFDTLKQAYIDYTDVDFIETRNGYLYKLSSFTPSTPANPLAFTTDLPATKTAAVGEDVTWTVAVTGGTAPYTYVWSYKASGGSYVVIDSSVNPTAATASLVNHAVTAESSGTYKCVVTDSASGSITSVESVLTVS